MSKRFKEDNQEAVDLLDSLLAQMDEKAPDDVSAVSPDSLLEEMSKSPLDELLENLAQAESEPELKPEPESEPMPQSAPPFADTALVAVPSERESDIEEEFLPIHKGPVELPTAAANLSLETIEQGRLLIESKKKRLWPLFVTGLVILIVATSTLVYADRIIVADREARFAQSDQKTSEILDESLALIQNADSVIVPLHNSIYDTIAEEDIPRLEALLSQKDSTLAGLDKAAMKATEAKEKFFNQEKKELAQNAINAAELRKQLLEKSCQITSIDIAAMKAAIALDYVVTLIIDADAQMRKAVDSVKSEGASAMSTSLEHNMQALEKLVLAEESLLSLDMSLMKTDIKSIQDYIAAKKASAELAIAADKAFLAGDTALHRSKTEEFNLKEQEAAALGALIPEKPIELIDKAHLESTAQLMQEYDAIFSAAADNDAFLRDYLGVTIDQQMNDGANDR